MATSENNDVKHTKHAYSKLLSPQRLFEGRFKMKVKEENVSYHFTQLLTRKREPEDHLNTIRPRKLRNYCE